MQKNKQKILIFLVVVFLSAGAFKVYAQTNPYPPPPPQQQNRAQATVSLTITGSTEPPPTTTVTPPPATGGGGGGSSGGGGGVSTPSPSISTQLRPSPQSVQPTIPTNVTTKPESTSYSASLLKSQKLKLYRQKIRQARLYATKIRKYPNLTNKQKKQINDLYITLYKLENRVIIPESLYPKIDKVLIQLQMYVEKNETMTRNDKAKINQVKNYIKIIKKRKDLKSSNKNKILKLEKKLDALLKTEEISLYDNENMDNLNKTFKLYAENKRAVQIDIYGSDPTEEDTKSLEILVDAIDEETLELKPDAIKQLNLENAISPNTVSLDQIADITQKEFRNTAYESNNSILNNISNNKNITTTVLLLWIIFLLLTIIKQQNEN